MNLIESTGVVKDSSLYNIYKDECTSEKSDESDLDSNDENHNSQLLESISLAKGINIRKKFQGREPA